jgi:hypothetical protein
MDDDIRILTSAARIDDPSAMAAFLAPIPDSQVLAELLSAKQPLNTRAYDDEGQAARFVISDGIVATCFAVTGITIDQAEMITLECEESDAWSDATFRAAADRILRKTL